MKRIEGMRQKGEKYAPTTFLRLSYKDPNPLHYQSLPLLSSNVSASPITETIVDFSDSSHNLLDFDT